MITLHQDPDTFSIVVAAFRYSLGRMTYMPSTFCDWYQRHHALVDPTGKAARLMLKELRETPVSRMGAPCDVLTWRRLQTWLQENFSQPVTPVTDRPAPLLH